MREQKKQEPYSKGKKPLISLFTGAGGLDLGLEKAGFEPRIVVENDADCRATLARNRSWNISPIHDVSNLSGDDLLNISGLKKGEAALISGGPPCQPFSKSGYWARGDSLRLQDHRATTLSHFLRLTEASLPKAILLENVTGMGYSKKSEAITLILESLKEINLKNRTQYAPQIFKINAADYGVPQIRERIFIVASREGKAFSLPPPTHGSDVTSGKAPWTTAWDALGDLTVTSSDEDLTMRGKWADLLPSIPEGKNYLWHTRKGGGFPIFGYRSRYWSFLLKMHRNLPSWTIQASPGPATGPFHWDNRRLSTREMARLQCFPDEYKFEGTIRSLQRQIGNAVPAAIGELFGKAISAQLFNEPICRELSLIPEKKPTSPETYKVQRPPTRFICDLVSPKDHPGEGKGPRGRLTGAGNER